VRDLSGPETGATLYEALATPLPPGVTAGETKRSAAKETVDADHEGDLAVLLLDPN
jgi:hypothetical protein